MCYAFGNHIYSLPSMTPKVFFVWQTYFTICIYANNFETIHNYIVPMKCWVANLKYLFFHFYDHISIPYLAIIFVLVFMQMLMTTYGILAWQTHFFSLISANTFWNCTHMSIYANTNAHEMLSWQPQVFYICKYICSLTSMVPLVFLV